LESLRSVKSLFSRASNVARTDVVKSQLRQLDGFARDLDQTTAEPFLTLIRRPALWEVALGEDGIEPFYYRRVELFTEGLRLPI